MNDTRYLVGKKNGKWYIRDVEEDLRWNDMTLPNDISKVCMIMNEQDQQIKAIEKLLDNELKKAFNNRINHDDYAEDAELAEYFKGYHCGVSDLKKKIRHILFNE